MLPRRLRSLASSRFGALAAALVAALAVGSTPLLAQAGADRAYSGEGEVALAFIEDILDSLGATLEQIDRERARAHAVLVGGC